MIHISQLSSSRRNPNPTFYHEPTNLTQYANFLPENFRKLLPTKTSIGKLPTKNFVDNSNIEK